MKLPLLLTQFLYQHKQLSLPGIGTFTLDPSAVIPEDPEKNTHTTIEGLSFSNKPVAAADPALIDFIRLHTGKIKPLAESDLESYLALGIQLLNIGKPFYFEGIGAVTKSQEGGYVFTPGEYSIIKQNDQEGERKERADKRKAVFEEQHDEQQSQGNSLRKVMVAIGIAGGLLLIGWGGYSLYKKNTYPENQHATPPDNSDTTAIKTDSSGSAPVVPSPADTSSANNTLASQASLSYRDSTLYKFVILATDNKIKALKRYDQLLSYSLKVKLQTKDSAYFKVYFTIPANPKDTLYIKDSLNRVYATKVYIER